MDIENVLGPSFWRFVLLRTSQTYDTASHKDFQFSFSHSRPCSATDNDMAVSNTWIHPEFTRSWFSYVWCTAGLFNICHCHFSVAHMKRGNVVAAIMKNKQTNRNCSSLLVDYIIVSSFIFFHTHRIAARH